MKIIVNFAVIVGVLETLLTLVNPGVAADCYVNPTCSAQPSPVCAYAGSCHPGQGHWETFHNKCFADNDACIHCGIQEYEQLHDGMC